eukprot:1369064-Amphidinium_carterae.1
MSTRSTIQKQRTSNNWAWIEPSTISSRQCGRNAQPSPFGRLLRKSGGRGRAALGNPGNVGTT